MGMTSSNWQQVKGNNNTWSMDLNVAKQFNEYDVADYARFSRLLNQLQGPQTINMAWNSANGVWEWEVNGWEWPWDDMGTPTEGANYGTGVNRDAVDSINCTHEWVNISFNHVQLACKHCGVDKSE